MSEIEKALLRRRPGLYRWLYEHHDRFAPVLGAKNAPWVATADAFAASRGGYSVTRQQVMQTWGRVVRDKAKFDQAIPKPRPSAVQPPQTVTRDLPPHDSRDSRQPGAYRINLAPREDDKKRLWGKPRDKKE